MATAMTTYMPAAYEPLAMDSLVDIGETAGIFADRNGHETMRSVIRDVFLRHNMQDTFGVGLLHKHYPVAANERIVELGPVSSPWVVGNSDEMPAGTLFAHTWRVFKGELRPVEYTFVPKRDVATTKRPTFPADFAHDIIEVLQATGLDDLLSIVLVDRSENDGDTMELTFGRSSIVIPTSEEEEQQILNDSNIQGFQAAWAFTKETTKTLHRTCGDAAGVQILHRTCGDVSGVKILHRTCGDASGVQTLHRTCGDASGIQTLHRTCGDASGITSLHRTCGDASGIQTLHRTCGDASGVQTLHRTCGDASSGVTVLHRTCGDASDVKTLHRTCGDASGVKTLHRTCGDASDVQTLHRTCGDASDIKTLHRTCGDASRGVKALHRTCGDASGIQALHRTCGDASGVKALHRTCGDASGF